MLQQGSGATSTCSMPSGWLTAYTANHEHCCCVPAGHGAQLSPYVPAGQKQSSTDVAPGLEVWLPGQRWQARRLPTVPLPPGLGGATENWPAGQVIHAVVVPLLPLAPVPAGH